jgi:kynureninase
MEDFVVITGSLYLVGEALGLLEPDAEQVPSERSLNNWRAGTGMSQTRAPSQQATPKNGTGG